MIQRRDRLKRCTAIVVFGNGTRDAYCACMQTSLRRHFFAVPFLAFVLLAVSTPARAQGFISPLIGYDFGGDSGCPELRNCEDKHLNIGVALGVLGPILGFEAEVADARNFFGEVSGQSSSVVTVMGNLMIVPRL